MADYAGQDGRLCRSRSRPHTAHIMFSRAPFQHLPSSVVQDHHVFPRTLPTPAFICCARSSCFPAHPSNICLHLSCKIIMFSRAPFQHLCLHLSCKIIMFSRAPFQHLPSSVVQVDQANLDILLVGDSVAMVVHGYDTTLPITMEEMLMHCRCVCVCVCLCVCVCVCVFVCV